jgi:hypothetical protein
MLRLARPFLPCRVVWLLLLTFAGVAVVLSIPRTSSELA